MSAVWAATSTRLRFEKVPSSSTLGREVMNNRIRDSTFAAERMKALRFSSGHSSYVLDDYVSQYDRSSDSMFPAYQSINEHKGIAEPFR